MKLVYFAWVRDRIGLAEEDVPCPAGVSTVAGVLDWLESRGDRYAGALSDRRAIRVAVNHAFADPDDPVADGDEVAVFPPVTGG